MGRKEIGVTIIGNMKKLVAMEIFLVLFMSILISWL